MDFQISTRINKVYTCVPAPAGVPTLPCSFISFCLAKSAPKLLLKACRQCHRINIINQVAVASSLQNHREKKNDGWDRKTSGGHSIPKRWKPWKPAPDAHAYHPESTWQSSTSCNHGSNENLVLKIFQYPYRRWPSFNMMAALLLFGAGLLRLIQAAPDKWSRRL